MTLEFQTAMLLSQKQVFRLIRRHFPPFWETKRKRWKREQHYSKPRPLGKFRADVATPRVTSRIVGKLGRLSAGQVYSRSSGRQQHYTPTHTDVHTRTHARHAVSTLYLLLLLYSTVFCFCLVFSFDFFFLLDIVCVCVCVLCCCIFYFPRFQGIVVEKKVFVFVLWRHRLQAPVAFDSCHFGAILFVWINRWNKEITKWLSIRWFVSWSSTSCV